MPLTPSRTNFKAGGYVIFLWQHGVNITAWLPAELCTYTTGSCKHTILRTVISTEFCSRQSQESVSGFDLKVSKPKESKGFYCPQEKVCFFSVDDNTEYYYCFFWGVFLPIHRCVSALYTQYFPESCEKISQTCYSGGIPIRTASSCRAASVVWLVRHCSGIARVVGSNPTRVTCLWYFFTGLEKVLSIQC